MMDVGASPINRSHAGQRVRVLQIIAGPMMGGIENQTLAFLQRFDRRKFEVDVCCLYRVDGPLSEQFAATQTPLTLCRWSGYLAPFVARLTRLLRGTRYDVVHARMSEMSGTAMLAARLAGVPGRVASYHHTRIWDDPGLAKRWAVGGLQRLTRRWATNVLGITEAVLDAYFDDWREHRGQFAVCYNGIDLARFAEHIDGHQVRRELGIPPEAVVVGNVGRLGRPKNHATFVDAAARLAKRRSDVWFLLVGDGELRSEIEARVARQRLVDRFVLAGNRSDVPQMLAAMDVFLMPSIHEGLGSVAIEAQAAGLPVVASNLPGIAEVLCPELRVLGCDPLDASGMADKLLWILNDVEERSRLGQLGREFVMQRFSIQRTVAQLERIYSEGRCPLVEAGPSDDRIERG